MKNLIDELHRRSLWQVLGIYLAGAWIALQVVDVINQNFGLPDWVPPFALILLVVGLPIVLATAFVQEGMKPGSSPAAPTTTEAGDDLPDSAAATTPATEATSVPAAGAPSAQAANGAHHRLFTWRNALMGGAAAFALLGVLTAAYLTMRTAGIGPAGTLVAKGILEDRSTVILADLDAEDEQLADAATEALRVDLSQSTVIRLAEPAVVADMLELMGRDPNERLTVDVAREVAQREGAAAVVTGEINRAGVGYVFSVQLITPGEGEALTSQRETAADSTEVIPAIDRLSSKLRERVGESLKSIRGKPPLERVTTSNLEALRLYSQTENRGNRRAIALYEQAIALDSGFAMAWRGLAIRLGNSGTDRAREVAAYKFAFENRDRLTQRERRLAAASYYNQVTFEHEKAIVEYGALLERDPDDETALNNLGVVYGLLGQEERAEELYLRKIELSPDEFAPGYWNAYQTRLNLGNFDGAREILDSARVRFGNDYAWQYAMASAVEGDLDKAESELLAIWAGTEPGTGGVAWIGEDLAAIVAARGRLGEASTYLQAAISANEDLGRRAEYLEDVIQAAWIELTVRGRSGSAVQMLEEALDRYPLSEFEALDRPYLELAQLYARAGNPDRAQALLAELASEVPEELRRGLTPDLLRAEGEIAVAEGRYEDAIRAFRRSFRGECRICGMAGLAYAYDRAAQPDSALAVTERFATTPFADRYAPYVAYSYALGPGVGPAYERVAQLADELGDLEKAAEYYARFVELWAEADDELQPRVQAAQARLEEIVRMRG